MVVRIDTDRSDQFNLETSDDTCILLEGVAIAEFNPPGNGIFVDTAFTGNLIRVLGRIEALGNAIASLATDTDVIVGNTAKLSGLNGISFSGNHSSLVNAGAIAGLHRGVIMESMEGDITNRGAILGDDNEAISLSNGNYEVVNDGSLSGTVGILSSGSDLVVRLGRESVINTSGSAISIASTSAETSRVTNAGLMTTSGITAYGGGSGADRLINTGTILGEVRFGNNDDVLDGRGGYISGRIVGNGGDDTFIIDDARADIYEAAGEGDDTIRTSVSYTLISGQEIERLLLVGNRDLRATGNELANELVGNAGANVLRGETGADTLHGGRGNDRLTGGGDADTFVFGTGDGRDTVTDFEDGAIDIVDLSDWKSIKTFNDMLAHADNRNGDVVISAGRDVLVIEDIAKGALDNVSFDFG